MRDGHLDDLLSEFLFSANFDGDTGKDRMAIAKYVERRVMAEREACANVADAEASHAYDTATHIANSIRSRP